MAGQGSQQTVVRDDLTSNLIHLTKGDTDRQAAEAFLSIFNSRELLGSSRDIRGDYKCVCFSEAPVAKLATILAVADQQAMRYKPFGVMFSKHQIFEMGGRPVIYQTAAEFELLHETQRFRHVRYEPGATDYTWEREWRLQTNSLALDPGKVTLVVPTRAWESWALARHAARGRGISIALQGLVAPVPFAWHFVVLEDMGVNIPAVDPPDR